MAACVSGCVVCVLSAVRRATQCPPHCGLKYVGANIRYFNVNFNIGIWLIKGASVGKKNFDIIKLHGTTKKKKYFIQFNWQKYDFKRSWIVKQILCTSDRYALIYLSARNCNTFRFVLHSCTSISPSLINKSSSHISICCLILTLFIPAKFPRWLIFQKLPTYQTNKIIK